jgi:iron complex outermembrane receptor protein
MFTTGGTSIALGTVTPDEALTPDAVMITYRNFGEVTYYGADLSFAYHINSNWGIGGTYSYVSKNFFAKNDENVHDIYLNAPRNKFGAYLRFSMPQLNLQTQARVRWTEGFEMYSPFVGSTVEAYEVVDLNAGIDVYQGARLMLTVQNLLDNKHIEFVGAPEIGRLVIGRMTYSF